MFVATTALRDFWDTESRFLLLGDWCRLYRQDQELEGLEYSVLPYPFDDKARFEEGVSYCDAFYEKSLNLLGSILNELHGVSLSPEYWRILLGPWLNHYIQSLYDRFLCVKDAQAQYGPLETIGLAEESYFVPQDVDEFLAFIHTDVYNLQLITQVCASRNVRIKSKKMMVVWSATILPVHWKARLVLQAKKILSSSFSRAAHPFTYLCGGQVWYFDQHIPFVTQLFLLFATRGKAVFMRFHRCEPRIGPLRSDPRLRNKLNALVLESGFGADEFGKVFASILALNFPLLYIEGYPRYVAQFGNLVKRSPRALVSSSNSVPFQFLSAQLKEKEKTRIVIAQRGGAFGANKYNPIEKHDQIVADEYWSWGWSEGLGGRATPMPAFLRNEVPSRGERSRTGDVLYCCNTCPRYTYRLWSNPNGPQWKQVIEWQHRWLASLESEVRAEVILRLYPYDHYLWKERERIRDIFPDLRLDGAERSFYAALDQAKLFVTDNNHTTFLQALAIEKPTILFWDPGLNELRTAAEPYFSRLRAVGVLHDSPEAAAHKVNEVSADPLAWWRLPDVQSAVGLFKKQFCYTDPKVAEVWAQSFRRLLRP